MKTPQRMTAFNTPFTTKMSRKDQYLSLISPCVSSPAEEGESESEREIDSPSQTSRSRGLMLRIFCRRRRRSSIIMVRSWTGAATPVTCARVLRDETIGITVSSQNKADRFQQTAAAHEHHVGREFSFLSSRQCFQQ